MDNNTVYGVVSVIEIEKKKSIASNSQNQYILRKKKKARRPTSFVFTTGATVVNDSISKNRVAVVPRRRTSLYGYYFVRYDNAARAKTAANASKTIYDDDDETRSAECIVADRSSTDGRGRGRSLRKRLSCRQQPGGRRLFLNGRGPTSGAIVSPEGD